MGFKRVKIDSAILIPRIDANLSTILSQYSTIFIKSYGSNTLATPSFRGTGAHHTQVEWNGININSPMLGQADLSQFPVSQFDKVELLYGATGLTRSSGAFGGIINLTTQPDWNNLLNVMLIQTLGSFNNLQTIASIDAGTRKFQSQTRINYGIGKNNFPYYNDITREHERMINNAYNQLGLSEDLYFRVNKHHFISGRFWYSQSNIEIPPLTTNIDTNHNEYQKDKSFRSVVEYKLLLPSFTLSAIGAWIDSEMLYVNDSLNNTHQYDTWSAKIRGKYTGFKKITIKPGLDYTFNTVNSEAYETNKRRHVAGGFVEMIYQPWSFAVLSLLARAEVVDGELMPFIPAIGMEFKPIKKWNLSLSANFSRNYRYPSLNDLYWENWGNPDLKPELSYGAEGGITWNWASSRGNLFIETEVTGYILQVDDIIVWTKEKEINPKWESMGKQLIYTAKNVLKADVKISWSGFYFSYIFNYISKRYLGKDNIDFMPGYSLSNIFLGKSFGLDKFVLSLQFEINNLFDLDYQSIANRPMPGINYGITLKGSFQR